MDILLTGGTGLIGRNLCRLWSQRGYRLWVLSRTPEKVARLCGPQVSGVASLSALDKVPLDAVVNLAGAPIADRPWTRARRELLWQSRVGLTEDLVAWLRRRAQRPAVLVSGSAVGYYGNSGEQAVDEHAPAGNDFAAQLCQAWEQAALPAEALGVRVALIRTGLVLAEHGGLLGKMLPAFRLGLGGRLGDGQQWMPWVHLRDEIGLIDFLLHEPQARGPYNACAPQPVRNAEFTRALAASVHRPALLPVPGLALRLGLGELSELLLGGQRALPVRAEAAGFTFHFRELDTALADLLERRDAA